MFKIGEEVDYVVYGKGRVVSISNEKGTLIVHFEKESEVLMGEVIDNDYYFEDTRRIETTGFIEVCQSNLEKINCFSKNREPHCHSCKNLLSNVTHGECKVCGWLLCYCGACGCNYLK